MKKGRRLTRQRARDPSDRDLHAARPVARDVAADDPGGRPRPAPPAGTVQTTSTRWPEATTIRNPTLGRDADDRRGPGGTSGGAASASLPRVLDGGVAEDRLVDLEAAVDDVEQDGLAGTRSTASGRNE